MTMTEMLKDLVDRGVIMTPGQNTLPNSPDNYIYVQTTTSYGVNLTIENNVGTKNAELERRS